MQNYKVISEQADFLVVFKPAGLPSAPITADDTENVFALAARDYPELLQVQGRKEVEHGLLHRLDTVTQGLVIIARTQTGYDKLQELQKQNKIIKTYTALCQYEPENAQQLTGFPPIQTVTPQDLPGSARNIESYFRPYGDGRKQVRPVTQSSGPAALKKLEKKVVYSTKVMITGKENELVRVECQITNGYRHQIRCHLAWIGLPIAGDPLYNAKYSQEQMYFCANKIDVDGNIFEVK